MNWPNPAHTMALNSGQTTGFIQVSVFNGLHPLPKLLQALLEKEKILVTSILPHCFLAHMSTGCSVSYCGHSPSVVVRPTYVWPSVHNMLVNTLASTNINQSSPNSVKIYMTTRPRMSSIMEPIGPELSELSALEFENLPYLTMFTL